MGVAFAQLQASQLFRSFVVSHESLLTPLVAWMCALQGVAAALLGSRTAAAAPVHPGTPLCAVCSTGQAGRAAVKAVEQQLLECSAGQAGAADASAATMRRCRRQQ